MRFINSTAALFLILLPSVATWAQQLDMGPSGEGPNYTLSADETFSGARSANAAGAAVYINTASTGTINLDGHQLQASDSYYGIYTVAGSTLNISGGTVNASNNKNNTSGWTTGTGIYANGADAQVKISNSNVVTDNNGQYGVDVSLASLTITGSGNIFSASGNTTANGAGGVGLYVRNGASSLSITGMEAIYLNNNALHGTQRRSMSAGAGQITLEANTIEAKDNGRYGLYLSSGDSAATNKVLNASGNGYAGVRLERGAVLNATAEQVLLNDNGWNDALNGFGIDLASGAKAYFTGLGETASFTATNNNAQDPATPDLWAGGAAINLTAADSEVRISNMLNIALDNNVYGIRVNNAAKVIIEGKSDSGGNALTNFSASGNKANVLSGSSYLGAGIMSSSATSVVSITGMNNIYLNDNGQNGGAYSTTSSITLEAANTIKANDNFASGLTLPDGSSLKTKNLYASGNSSSGFILSGANSTATIAGGEVLLNNNANGNGLYARTNATVDITGAGTGSSIMQANSNNNTLGMEAVSHGRGVMAYSGGVINISNIDVEAKENYQNGVSAAGAGRVNISGANAWINDNALGVSAAESGIITITGDGSNTLQLNNNSLYGISVKDSGAVVDITGMLVSGSLAGDSLVVIEGDGGNFNLTDSSITAQNGNLFYVTGGAGAKKYTISNSSAISMGTSLMISGADEAILEATAGSYLENAIIANEDNSLTASLTGSKWVMKNSSNFTGLTASSSEIDLRGPAGNYNTLTLNELISNNTTYTLKTYFDAAGLTSDKIIVDGGDAVGAGNKLRIIPTGHDGSYMTNGYGIEVVNLQNAADKTAQFTLPGGVVNSGAYDYILYQAEDFNYYLQGTDTPTDIARTITNMPAVDLAIIRTGIGELRKHLASLRKEKEEKQGFWVSSYAKNLKAHDTITAEMAFYGAETGYDKKILDGENSVYLGLTAGYLYTDGIKIKNDGRDKGRSFAKTPAAGVYGMWINEEGYFTNLALRSFWTEMRATNYTAAGDAINYHTDRHFIAAAFEAGKSMEWGAFVLEPKAEIQYVYAKGNSFKTDTNNAIKYSSANGLNTRAAVNASYNLETADGRVLKPFIEAGLSNEWNGRTDVEYAGAKFKSDLSGINYDFALGLYAPLGKSWLIYADAVYEAGAAYESIGANLGFNFKF